MKKRLISLILAVLMLLSCALAEETGNVPLMAYYECFAVPLGENALFEIPNEWGYQTSDAADVPPMTSLLTDQNQMVMAMKLPADWEATDASDALGIQSFMVEGTALMLGLTTPQSTRLQEMTINDMPAVLVSMNGQGFDILWVGDSGDLYFFLFPNDDDALVQQMISVAQSLCVFRRKGEQVNPSSDFAYTADGGEVTITDYVGTSEHVLIPDTIDGLPVTALGHRAFYEKTVTTVVVPDSVTEIGAACFSGDNYLVSLKLPDGLKRLPPASLESCMRLYDFDLPQSLEKIYSSVFEFNYYLTHLTLPSSLTEIEQLNFIGLYGLQSLTLAEDNAAFKLDETNGLLMTADGTRLLHCFSDISPAEEIILPEGVKIVDPFAFHYDYDVKRIVLPEGVETIGAMAFAMCPNLTEIVIPASVTDIGVMDGLEGRTGIISYKHNVIVTPEGSPAWNWAVETGATVKSPEEN
jgi:cell surface protein